MKKLSIKGPRLFILCILFLLIVLTSPFWLWQLKPAEELDILIVDKTVPSQSYQEHQGLTWILNNNKYLKTDGNAYVMEEDYVGFHPKNNGEYTITEIPDQLDSYPLIYLADLYGVYEEEFYGPNETGEQSELIYGGLQEAEVDRLEETLYENGNTLIAEFNTFASPTEPAIRERMYNLLNIGWGGWMGRYFSDLSNMEVPNWVKENLANQGQEWKYQGSGFVFINKENFVYVVSEDGITAEGIQLESTEKGEAFFGKDIHASYGYWFDVITANDEEEVLATYTLPVKESEKEALKSFGIPTQFPAIVQQQNASFTTYYFAGDYADQTEVPGIYQTEGLGFIRELQGNQDFYWDAYVPVMTAILDQLNEEKVEQETVRIVADNGVQTNAQTSESYIQLYKDDKWEDFLIKGVNMGITKAGAFPGETAITQEEYFSWFQQIGDMNANSIRIYTIHPPGFYDALYAYNQLAENPLYVFHGLWVNEEDMLAANNAFSPKIVEDVEAEIERVVDIIHGNAVLPERPGHASGSYTKDVSPYVLGIIFGTEWDPYVVQNTNDLWQGMEQLDGAYVKTTVASPFEIWIAQMMEYTAEYETEQYDWQHALSFTNWVTTDLLDHPVEPLEQEDLVSLNPNHISTTDQFTSGMFASYHVYPYYPDFLNLNPEYTNYLDDNDEKNNYAGYLNELRKAHEMPVLVAEFGVPASRGLTHRNVHGMDQGFLSEVEQGDINQKLFESIVAEDYAGGLVFSWQDEWFKRTWNTMDYDNPDRRPYWNNYQTNEQHFGLLSYDPGTLDTAIYADGNSGDWERKGIEPAFQAPDPESFVKQMYVDADEGTLNIRIDLARPIDWENDDLFLAFDTIDAQGQTDLHLANDKKVAFDFAADFKLALPNPEEARLVVDSYYDVFYYQYGEDLEMIATNDYANQKDNGVFHPIRLALNKELVVPTLDITLPFESYETGKLLFGNSNPTSEDYHSLTDISSSADNMMLEIQIPWLLLNVKDPSLKEVMGDIWNGGLASSTFIEGITIGMVAIENEKVTEQAEMYYQWETWNQPTYHERLKPSYYIMQELYQNIELVEE